jgi:hypothetical protein
VEDLLARGQYRVLSSSQAWHLGVAERARKTGLAVDKDENLQEIG